jgi:hypothetical protein
MFIWWPRCLFWRQSKHAVGLDETEPSYFGVASELDSARNDAHSTKECVMRSPLTLLAAPQPPRLSGGCWPAACGRWLSGEPPLSGAATVFDAPRSAAPCDPAGSLISSSQLRQVSHRRSLLPLRSRSRRRTHHGPRRQHLLWLRAHAPAEGRGPPLHVRHSCRLHWPWQAVLQQRPGGARW